MNGIKAKRRKNLRGKSPLSGDAAPGSQRLDRISWHLLELLQSDARATFAELGRRVGLSTPAVAERVKKLEESGVILGYHAQINPFKVGVAMQVIIRLAIEGGEPRVRELLKAVTQMPEIVHCHRVTGEDGFIFLADIMSIQHLSRLLERMFHFGRTSTMTVLSTVETRRNYVLEDLEALSRET